MGFKTAGFPAFGFNPLGFRTSLGRLAYLIKNCGLLFYHDTTVVDDGIIHDKVSKAVRPSYLGRELVGNGLMYGDTTIVPTQNTALRVWGNFNSIATSQYFGERTSFGVNEFRFGVLGANQNYEFYYGSSTYSSLGLADTLKHKFEIMNGEFFVDDVKLGGINGDSIGTPLISIFLLALNNNGSFSSACDFTMDRCEIEENGELIFLLDNFQEVQDTADTSQAKIYDATGNYAMQLSNTHVNYVQENIDIDSTADNQGVKVASALGKNKFYEFDITTPVGGTTRIGNKYFSDARGSDSIWFSRIDASNITDITLSYLTDGNQELKADFSDSFVDTSADAIGITSGGINLVSGSVLNNTSNEKWLYITFRASVAGVSGYVENLQLELGSVATAYESWKGLYKDSLLTEPYSDGQLVLPLYANGAYTSQARAFVDGGARYVLTGNEWKEVEKALRVVDGVVDFKTQMFNSSAGGTYTQDFKEVTVTSAAVANSRVVSDVISATNTEKTIKFKASKISGTDNALIRVRNSLDTVTLATLDFTTDDIDFSTTFTPTDGGYTLRMYGTVGTAEIAEKRYYDGIVFEGTVEPTSQQTVVGNSYLLRYPYPKIAQADTNRILTEVDGTPKLLAVADAQADTLEQYFVKLDDTTSDMLSDTFYKEPLVGECLNRALIFQGIDQFLLDEQADFILDESEDKILTDT